MKRMLRRMLVAFGGLAFASGGAFADDDDDKNDRNKCTIEMAEVVDGSLILTGQGLTRKDRRPVVILSGEDLTVDTASSTEIVALLNGELEPRTYVVNVFRKVKVDDDDDDDDEDVRKLRDPCHPFEVAVGAIGPQGEQGDPGADGTKGDTGPKGDKGDTGDTGPQGEDGAGGAITGLSSCTASVSGESSSTSDCATQTLCALVSVDFQGTSTDQSACKLSGDAGTQWKLEAVSSTGGITNCAARCFLTSTTTSPP